MTDSPGVAYANNSYQTKPRNSGEDSAAEPKVKWRGRKPMSGDRCLLDFGELNGDSRLF